MKLEQGTTRFVVVFKKIVIKFPVLTEWRLFLHGLLNNMQERSWNGKHHCFAKIFWANRFGLFVVMEKAEPISDIEWYDLEAHLTEKYKGDELINFILSDCKISNWGYVGKKLVKIDYGD